MFRRILIANRGEIAVRIIRACREKDITSIAVHSEPDRNSLHVFLADESICIGPAPLDQSYLNMPGLIAAAEACDADAIHPGYGFLAENTKFAGICRDCNIAFIGPTTNALKLSGDKAACREIADNAGVPIIDGSADVVHTPEEARAIADDVGFPVLVKAASGGGGKGMRIAHNDAALSGAFTLAANEAAIAFGDPRVYIERFVENARHIEFQIIADEHGACVALGERECTIQRRHQKLIEEAPAPTLDDDLRNTMADAALRVARAMGYTNAGTAEFLLTTDERFYFIEFNARIQVEHPVTEEVTGLDLIREQIRVAAGEPLGYADAPIQGHAIEARVYAEDPERDFAPCAGTINRCHIPGGPGIRVDTDLFAGCKVMPDYDPLLAKVIARGHDRDQAIRRLGGALDEVITEGVCNTAGLCARIIRGDRFGRGELSGDIIEEYI